MAALARTHACPDPAGADTPAAARPESIGTAATTQEPQIDVEPEGRDRRGPFRPDRLISARARRSGALAARFFHATDLVVLALLALALGGAAAPGPLLDASLRGLLPFACAYAVAIWLLQSLDLYAFGRVERLGVHLWKLAALMAGAAMPALIVAGLTDAGAASAIGVSSFCILGAVSLNLLHVWWWSTVRRWRNSGRLTPNVVIVGATRHAERLIQAALARRDVNVIGVFDDRMARSPKAVGGVPVLGDTRALLEHRITPFVDKVVVAVDPGARVRVREIVDRLRVLPNEVSLLVDLETDDDRSAALARMADTPLTRLSGGMPEDDRRAFAKRLQDLFVGGLAAALLAPLMLLIAIAVKLDSRGPVFFRQKRHGFNNETITVWKFRTMRHEAADARAERQVTADDDRVTRLGRFLRMTSLDELPQLLNVLRGEMSLVGPRPHAIGMKTGAAESARLVGEYAWRHRMKPGMTGWAAIHGSRGPLHTAADVRRRVALDIEYIERQSFWLDLWVMTMTIPCLLGDRRAVR